MTSFRCRLVALVTLLALSAPLATFAAAGRSEAGLMMRKVCLRGVCFQSEVVVTDEERSRGLMFRDTLAKDRGMLFVFPREGYHRFWMKNTRIELDIIFIGGNQRIVSIARRAKPCTKEPCDLYAPAGDVLYALEIAGGLAAVYGFAPGDLMEFR